VARRDILRAFRVPPSERAAVTDLLRQIEHAGPRPRESKRPTHAKTSLPEIGVIEITDVDFDGEMLARPAGWSAEAPPPKIVALAERGAPALGVGERAVARISRLDDGTYEARIVRAVEGAPDRVVGIFHRDREGGRLEPTDRKVKTEFRIAQIDSAGALDGEIVLAEAVPGRRLGLPQALVLERIGSSADPRAFSLIAIHTHGIPTIFPVEAIREAEAAKPVTLGRREDLRAVPLITIDGADARDFDDAVWAEPDGEVPDGWHLLVAIADVAWYVRPGQALDRTARERGNSAYFPDRVVPMLPEALSNELCSLKPHVDRACVAVHLWIDGEGELRRHRFCRGLMRSAARLTYEQAQTAIDGNPDAVTEPVLTTVLRPLHGAFLALDRARRRRGTLDLDLPERRVLLDPTGRVARIEPRARLDSHKLIEEFMIAANVAAAETLEKLKQLCMYRDHDSPDLAKIGALREFLNGLNIPGLALAKGQVVRPRHFNQILAHAAGTPQAQMINTLVLRSQAQAVYSPNNIGHFGLALRRYAHFTSPIRRYSDLLVHRALAAGHHWSGESAQEANHQEFVALGEHISMTERRSAAAERSALDRYTAAYLADRIGATFTGRVNGVTRAGLFITLDDSGADGLVPISTLPGDYYLHDEKRHRLVGRRTGTGYTLGDRVIVKLAEANTVTGSLAFILQEERTPPRSRRAAPATKKRR